MTGATPTTDNSLGAALGAPNLGAEASSALSALTNGAVMTQPQAAAAAAQVQSPTLGSFLGLKISSYDIAMIIVGGILVIGAIFFISKPAVQSVAVTAGKVAKAVAK